MKSDRKRASKAEIDAIIRALYAALKGRANLDIPRHHAGYPVASALPRRRQHRGRAESDAREATANRGRIYMNGAGRECSALSSKGDNT